MTSTNFPPKLSKGDRVAVIAPSSPATRRAIQPGVAYLESMDLEVVEGTTVGLSDRFFAGSDKARAEEITRLFSDESIRGIFAARGGYGSARVLSEVDWNVVRSHPKVLVGFSDTTALQLGALAQANLVTYSGMVLNVDVPGDEPVDCTLDSALRAALFEGRFEAISGLRVLRSGGSVEGPLVGGCLSLVASLAGTPYLPSFESCILFLEDVGEAPYRIDRLLTQLIQSGLVDMASAVVFGDFVRCGGDAEDGTVDQVLEDFVGRVTCSVYTGLPYGHGPTRRVLPIGGAARLVGDRLVFEGIA